MHAQRADALEGHVGALGLQGAGIDVATPRADRAIGRHRLDRNIFAERKIGGKTTYRAKRAPGYNCYKLEFNHHIDAQALGAFWLPGYMTK